MKVNDNGYIVTDLNETPLSYKKNLIKITDILGRETKVKKNEPFFYIYDDGTVEKRIIID